MARLVLLLALVALGQTACSHQVSVCHAAAARIDREYFTALVAGCAGYELDVCPARDAIEAQYTVRYEAAAKDCK